MNPWHSRRTLHDIADCILHLHGLAAPARSLR